MIRLHDTKIPRELLRYNLPLMGECMQALSEPNRNYSSSVWLLYQAMDIPQQWVETWMRLSLVR